jgi:hypothetical protein
MDKGLEESGKNFPPQKVANGVLNEKEKAGAKKFTPATGI